MKKDASVSTSAAAAAASDEASAAARSVGGCVIECPLSTSLDTAVRPESFALVLSLHTAINYAEVGVKIRALRR